MIYTLHTNLPPKTARKAVTAFLLRLSQTRYPVNKVVEKSDFKFLTPSGIRVNVVKHLEVIILKFTV